jgi:hypothetical protein
MSIHMTRLTNDFPLLYCFRSIRYPDKFQILDCRMIMKKQPARKEFYFILIVPIPFGSTKLIHEKPRWSRWPRGLKSGYAATSLLGMLVRFPPKVWMSVSCDYFMLSSKCLWQRPIPRPEDSYRACASHWVWSGATITLYTYNEFSERGHIKKERKTWLKITHYLNEIWTRNLPNTVYKC